MRKIYVIIMLFLMASVLAAQVPGFNNGDSRWLGNSSRKNQVSFFKENNAFSRIGNGSSGPSYGFVGNGGSSAYCGEWRGNIGNIGLGSSSRACGVRVNVAATRRESSVSAPVRSRRTLLNNDVRREGGGSGGGGGFSGGGTDAANYGRRVKPQSAPRSSVGLSSSSGVLVKSVLNTENSALAMSGDLDGSADGGMYGFGEVPHDDLSSPVGDGVWLLALLAVVAAIVKRYLWNQ